ncbi:toprim domain-containing protein [Spirosoma sordidisoli]|uniref:Toprim domain-containing protein n=1 Tax=Spirosoma sordidisoli TaxID=2502893 RepID=A0A4Q2UHL3_9BACT|nr:toprim domain-containing protein [Spirosoma sordidisoli]RYC66965.1 hypothetical protein EQG79_26690 [Spirosoma sordidisoli]
MNIDQAKTIPIADILGQLNIQPRKTSPDKLLYLSPIRKEKTPSFWVYLKPNRWHDYGIGQGGDPVDLICAYLRYIREDHTVVDALRWITNMHNTPYAFAPVYIDAPAEEDDHCLSLKKVGPIEHVGLVHYVHKRGIPTPVANMHLKQVHVRNKRTGKSFFALGFDNEEGGYELRNPFFKGSLGRKSVSFIRGTDPQANGIHIFEGAIDYLSAVAQLKGERFKGDTIVLNSLSCLKQLLPYVHNYGYRTAYTWLDNDTAGKTATRTLGEFFKTQVDLTHKCMNRLYAPHKDVNAWHMHQLGLTL